MQRKSALFVSGFLHVSVLYGMAMWTPPESFQEVAFQVMQGNSAITGFNAPPVAEQEMVVTYDAGADDQSNELLATAEVSLSPPNSSRETIQHSQTEAVSLGPSESPSPPNIAAERSTASQPPGEPSVATNSVTTVPRHDSVTEPVFDGQSVAVPSSGSIGGVAAVDFLPRILPANPSPPFPVEALRAGVVGRVRIRVLVLANGRAGAVRIETSSGSEALDESALNTVRNWRFAPARLGGKPVDHEVIVPVKFSIVSR